MATPAGLPAPERATLPGISPARARRSPAGAVVAHTTMRCPGLGRVTLGPRALREGVTPTALHKDGSLRRHAPPPLLRPAEEPARSPAPVG
ncbi:hypothetical protein SUDANB126_06273 [Streptomyces sp. enrichment culture]